LHPKLPASVKGLLEPIACIPQSVKERVSSPLKPSLICLVPTQCSKVSKEYFYAEKPPYLGDAHIAAIEYLFLQRDGDMYEQSTPGMTEASWALYTKDRLFMPREQNHNAVLIKLDSNLSIARLRRILRFLVCPTHRTNSFVLWGARNVSDPQRFGDADNPVLAGTFYQIERESNIFCLGPDQLSP